MFDLNYPTRCFLCRAGFLALCLMPTAAVMLWAARMNLPQHAEACRRQMQQELQLPVTLAGVSHPRPGTAVYEQIELADPETGAVLAKIARLEASGGPSAMVLIARQVHIETGALPSLQALLEQRLQKKSTSPVTLVIDRLTVEAEDQAYTVSHFSGQLETLDEGPQFSAQFEWPQQGQTSPVKIRMARIRDDASVHTGVELEAPGASLPCSLAWPVLPWLRRLGPKATFTGRLLAFAGDEGRRGGIDSRSRLAGIDLQRLIAADSPRHMSGLAEIRLEQARFAASRLTDLSGRVVAGPGAIGQSLREAAIGSLDLNYSQAAVGGEQPILYEQLAFDFHLDRQGLSLRGCCDRAPPGAVLADGDQWLLGEPKRQPLPAAALIHLLAPAEASQVPANRQSGWLLGILPLP